MSDMDIGSPPDLETPSPQLFMRRAADKRAKADAGMNALNLKRRSTDEKYSAERNPLEDDFIKSGDELSAMKPPTPEKMPDPNLGPMMDPKQASSFLYGMTALSLLGAIGGRKNWHNAASAMDGALKGFVQGNMQVASEKKAEFDREYKIAHEKQAEADKQYSEIIKSKTMSLNMKAARLKALAASHGDDVMRAAAEQKDYDMMYRLADQAEGRAATMQSTYDKIKDKQDTAKAKAGAKAGDAGNQGISEKYRTDPEYAKKVNYWAQFVADGNSLPPRFAQSGMGKGGYTDIMNVVPTLNGGDAKSMRAGQVELAGQKSQARALGTRTAAIEQAASEAREMSSIVLDTSEKFGRTGFQPVNKALAAYEKNTGGTEVRQFGAAINSYINAYARAVNPSGVATVSDKEHAREMLSTADTKEQVKAIIAVLDREMTAAQHSPQNVKKSLRKEIMGGDEGGKGGGTVNWTDLK